MRNLNLGKTSTHQKGFTLIELMIVVAIIGILASVAVPQYKTYIGRAIVTEGIAGTEIIKISYEEYVQTQSVYPQDITDIAVDPQFPGTYVTNVNSIFSDPYYGYLIQFSQTDEALPVGIQGNFIYFIASAIGGNLANGLKWRCAVDFTADGVYEQFVPSSCRGSLF